MRERTSQKNFAKKNQDRRHAATLAGVGVLPTNENIKKKKKTPREPPQTVDRLSLGHTHAVQTSAHHITQHTFRAIPLPTIHVKIILYGSVSFVASKPYATAYNTYKPKSMLVYVLHYYCT